jgi:phosphonate transport system substrate-binding protein
MTFSLKAISIQSESMADTCRQITRYLGDKLGLATEFINDISWPEREARLDAGQAHLGWICGLPYVWKADQQPAPVELVAAPVMQHPRYQQQPVYFSDVIVRRDSSYTTFADLRGAAWAYNEPHSQSGYNITRYHLASLGENNGYFGQVVAAGSHLRAIELVLNRGIAASAIDSTVLELEFQVRPWLKEKLRIIEALGPSPMPPWVVSTKVPPELRQAIREVFWQMHKTEAGQAILAKGQLMRLMPVEDSDYDPIRKMAKMAAGVVW